ncbi:DNA polymerase I [Fructilactobacillus florum]|uniref:DNA polymerase I n=1 Tax=Fructilactobacillus florum DSM 22689 = JCM 16035 TaxID=1423745 RepID=A0A0R2CPT3_9LACO|nr:DNA polymerase I [Fructilactobacillus florum]KRM91844.1 DNA polymerase I [Fructilactobacillus florum DSM 22689 = JCM 16035]
MAAKKLLLLDGNSLSYKAFFALYPSLDRFTNADGLHTNAIYGLNRMLDDLLKKMQPTAVLAAFDAGKTTFRTKMYSEYKSGRAKMPEELREQFPFILDLLKARGIATYELADYEADDIIGTVALRAEQAGYQVEVVTGDRDLTQLCSDHTTVSVSKKGVSELVAYTPAYVQETMGIEPRQIIDVKGLQGDQSDNYPGVRKVGPKTAVKLIHQFGTIEQLYQQLDQVSGKKLRENLELDHEQALLSKQLATINRKAPITIDLSELTYQATILPELADFYRKMNFKSFLKELGSDYQVSPSLPKLDYQVLTEDNLQLVNELGNDITFNLEMLTSNYHTADQIGFVIGDGQRWLVSQKVELLQSEPLRKILADERMHKNVFDNKSQIVGLHRLGVQLANVDFDMLLASYLLNTLNNADDVGEVANRHDYQQVRPDQDVYGKGKQLAVPASDVLFEHMVQKALAIQTLKPTMLADLKKHEQLNLYRNLEVPLSRSLSDMEITGITVNAERLTELKSKFSEQLAEIEQSIYQSAGMQFNISSPKQLGEVLFEKMQLPVLKKTKTGYSTSVDVLEKLAPDYPIIEKILNYRQLTKLISTYIDGIIGDIFPDGKVHTRYLQTLAQTGRLSSVDPNLQNIPVRTEAGRQIRSAFVPRRTDWQLFSSDYSQIELRVLAAISKDQQMQAAFADGDDIHAATARRIFSLPADQPVDAELRRQAKAVNFGIVYGISAYGLANNTGISKPEAQQFIDRYFAEYPKVKEYMEKSVTFAKEHGYVETIAKRRRYIPEINSKRFQQRQFAERVAMNSPIQGSAADIIKAAMVKMNQVLRERSLQAQMLLQIHDELIFEAPKSEIPVLEQLVPQVMDSIIKTDSVLQAGTAFDVPLKVESHFGDNWYNIKK